MKLVYDESGERIVLGEVLTNHSMSIEDVIDLLEIDMEQFAYDRGWDDWNYEALKLED